MFSSIKPKADLDILFARGTDIEASGRFKCTLAFNNFKKHDAKNLQEIFERIKNCTPTMNTIFRKYLEEIAPNGQNPITEAQIDSYLKQFFLAERNDDYVNRTVKFFDLLRRNRFEPGKLIVVFNQFSFYLNTHILHNFALNRIKHLII